MQTLDLEDVLMQFVGDMVDFCVSNIAKVVLPSLTLQAEHGLNFEQSRGRRTEITAPAFLDDLMLLVN